ncbi:uncharacterized protein LOC129755814 [Uranotaenia lowii]|uniref:uncharacterized protein LOC129755814 n=1 Tax=Uranotaenia lowii TaxID=190385 RepID=UPI0024793920|nr:uncharacterized protein LOC129755814 [Uranotaenia lowii]
MYGDLDLSFGAVFNFDGLGDRVEPSFDITTLQSEHSDSQTSAKGFYNAAGSLLHSYDDIMIPTPPRSVPVSDAEQSPTAVQVVDDKIGSVLNDPVMDSEIDFLSFLTPNASPSAVDHTKSVLKPVQIENSPDKESVLLASNNHSDGEVTNPLQSPVLSPVISQDASLPSPIADSNSNLASQFDSSVFSLEIASHQTAQHSNACPKFIVVNNASVPSETYNNQCNNQYGNIVQYRSSSHGNMPDEQPQDLFNDSPEQTNMLRDMCRILSPEDIESVMKELTGEQEFKPASHSPSTEFAMQPVCNEVVFNESTAVAGTVKQEYPSMTVQSLLGHEATYLQPVQTFHSNFLQNITDIAQVNSTVSYSENGMPENSVQSPQPLLSPIPSEVDEQCFSISAQLAHIEQTNMSAEHLSLIKELYNLQQSNEAAMPEIPVVVNENNSPIATEPEMINYENVLFLNPPQFHNPYVAPPDNGMVNQPSNFSEHQNEEIVPLQPIDLSKGPQSETQSQREVQSDRQQLPVNSGANFSSANEVHQQQTQTSVISVETLNQLKQAFPNSVFEQFVSSTKPGTNLVTVEIPNGVVILKSLDTTVKDKNQNNLPKSTKLSTQNPLTEPIKKKNPTIQIPASSVQAAQKLIPVRKILPQTLSISNGSSSIIIQPNSISPAVVPTTVNLKNRSIPIVRIPSKSQTVTNNLQKIHISNQQTLFNPVTAQKVSLQPPLKMQKMNHVIQPKPQMMASTVNQSSLINLLGSTSANPATLTLKTNTPEPQPSTSSIVPIAANVSNVESSAEKVDAKPSVSASPGQYRIVQREQTGGIPCFEIIADNLQLEPKTEPNKSAAEVVQIHKSYCLSNNGSAAFYPVKEMYEKMVPSIAPDSDQPMIANEAPSSEAANGGATRKPRKSNVNYNTGWYCAPCEKSFGRKGSLKQHITSYHSEPKPFECGTCGKRYATEPKLQEHESKHSEEAKKFQCSDCPKKYVHLKDRDRHWILHHGQPPIYCKYCGKGYCRADHLLAHEISHEKHRDANGDVIVRPGKKRKHADTEN